MEGKNPEALDQLEWETSIAYSYLSWLHREYLTESVTLEQADLPDHLSPRQKHNFNVLNYGYTLLEGFVNYLCEDSDQEYTLPPRSWELALQDAQVAASENPIVELIRWAYESNHDAVFQHPNDETKLAISPIELMRIQNAPWGPKLPLPFEKHTAFGRWLEDHLQGDKDRVFYDGKQRRVYVVDYHEVINE